MTNVKIYKPSKNTMQSGRALIQDWILEADDPIEIKPESLMGWTSASSTAGQIKLKFSSLEDAQSYAEKKGWDYIVIPAHERKLKPRNYGDNFKYIPPKSKEKT